MGPENGCERRDCTFLPMLEHQDETRAAYVKRPLLAYAPTSDQAVAFRGLAREIS
jgi:hypothetical protein